MKPPELSNITQPPFGVRLSQREVAALFGVSRTRIYQIEQRALSKLRRRPELRKLAAMLDIIAEPEETET